MANRRYSANHSVKADMSRPSPGSSSSGKHLWNGKEKTANWKTDIGPSGPRMNKVKFPEVKTHAKQRMNDDFMMPGSVYDGPPAIPTREIPIGTLPPFGGGFPNPPPTSFHTGNLGLAPQRIQDMVASGGPGMRQSPFKQRVRRQRYR